jgi:cell division protease FtsH
LKKLLRGIIPWVLIIILVIFAYQIINYTQNTRVDISYSKFLEQLDKDNINEVVFTGNKIKGNLKHEARTDKDAEEFKEFETIAPVVDNELLNRLEDKNVIIVAEEESNTWTTILITVGPWVLLIGLWFFFFRRLRSSGNRAFDFSKSRAKLLTKNRPDVDFNDVAGLVEAKEELKEIVEFLKNPRKFTRLGGEMPSGILLLGPPGTGKTLLARAVSGEAKVPFFTISGSDFVELFVGVGAARVRDLFEQAKKNAPCIVFIDELDSVGRTRGAGIGGGHDEREQTLNQLLAEMDGFETNTGVIIMAATNRPDVLDPALLRPGRFDRQIIIDLPDLKAREEILEVHARDVKMSDDVDLSIIARGTPNFSGADLENLINEAAILAARKNNKSVTMEELEEARDRVMMGPERRSKILSEEEKVLSAYHEVGHALMSIFVEGVDPVHKITIIPRGLSLGQTQFLPIDEKHTYNESYVKNRLVALLGGRAAEELKFGEVSTGSGNDLKQATEIARKMVCEWGMSDKLGPVVLGRKEGPVFLGKDITHLKDYSEKTAELIDKEIRSFVDEAFDTALSILKKHKDDLDNVAEVLLERETLSGEDLKKLIEGEELEPLDTKKPESLENKEKSKKKDKDKSESLEVEDDKPEPTTA